MSQPYPPPPGQTPEPADPQAAPSPWVPVAQPGWAAGTMPPPQTPAWGPAPPQQYGPPAGWVPAAPPVPPALPVVPREYHEFYRTPRFRWWRPLLALAMFGGTWFIVSILAGLGVIGYEMAVGNLDPEALLEGEIPTTPVFFLVNNLGLALAIPLAWAAHRVVFGQGIGWLSSIAGRFRWGLFGRFAGFVLACYLVWTAVEIALGGVPQGLAIRPETGFLLVSVLLTTPLQAAGEEFALRGLGARAIGSWFPASRIGLVVSTAITGVAFMLLHGAGDPWLNAFYLYFGVLACVLTWRTGGLEAAVALHVVNNLLGLAWVPFTGVEGLFDREAGVGDPTVLLQMGVVTLVAAGLLWLGSRAKLSRSAAPGVALEAQGQAAGTPNGE